ncbi:MAG: hypothetical protein ACI30A_02515 [Paludibacteraceae bacterium]
MKVFLKYLGVLLLLIGVVFLVVYHFAVPQNYMLVIAMVFEVVGILTHILVNKYLE